MDEYEAVLLVKPEVFMYRIPPRATSRGYKASDWKLETPDWTGKMQVVSKGKKCFIKLLDKNTGELFAQAPVDKYPGLALEPVMDSSRYFVLRVEDDTGRAAFIGIGFADRSDSFDLNVALQDHFKWLEKSEEIEQEVTSEKPGLDLGFKDGQTITINMNIAKKSGSSARSRTKPSSAGTTPGLLPPPPSGLKIPPPSAKATSSTQRTPEENRQKAQSSQNELLDFGSSTDFFSTTTTAAKQPSELSSQAAAGASADLWSDFTSADATSTSNSTSQPSAGTSWIDF